MFPFPANAGGRFSRNARVPSRLSSVAVVRPNAAASNRNPLDAFCEGIAGGGAFDHAGGHALDARGCAFGRVDGSSTMQERPVLTLLMEALALSASTSTTSSSLLSAGHFFRLAFFPRCGKNAE